MVVNAKLAVDRYVALGSLTDLPTLRSNLLPSADYLMSNICFYRLRSIAVTCSCYLASKFVFILFSSYFGFPSVHLHIFVDFSCALLLFTGTTTGELLTE
jgi:hypothetical protein